MVRMTAENMAIAESEGFEKRFKVSTTLSTSNMVCFNHEGHLTRYRNAEEILAEFYDIRLWYYQKRKVFKYFILVMYSVDLDICRNIWQMS